MIKIVIYASSINSIFDKILIIAGRSNDGDGERAETTKSIIS